MTKPFLIIDECSDTQGGEMPASPGTAKLRVNAGVLEVSSNAGSWSAVVTDSSTTVSTALASGVLSGLLIEDRISGATKRIIGSTALASVTGYNTGTAGAGTTTTSMAKPSGGSNWSSNALVGKYLKGTDTNGDRVLRPILSNTTTTLAVNTVVGMAAGFAFDIVDLDSDLDYISADDPVALRISGCVGPVEVYGVAFSAAHTLTSLIDAADSSDVRFVGCDFDQNLASAALNVERCTRVRLEHCRFTASSDAAIARSQHVEITGCVNSEGGVIAVSDCGFVDVTKLSAVNAPSRVVSLIRIGAVSIEAACSDGGATPIYFESCDSVLQVGGLLTGTGNTGYGIEIANTYGFYALTGATITGTLGDILFASVNQRYTDELSSTYGAVASMTTRVVAQTIPTKTIVYGNVLFNGSGDHSSRELYYGIINPAQDTGITAAGSVSGDAYQLPAGQFYGVGTVASGTGVKLHNASALPGPECVIYNSGANTLKVYPTSGTINGAASVDVASGAIVMLICVDYGADKWMSI